MDKSPIIKTLLDIFNSFNEDEIQFACTALVPQLDENELKLLEEELIRDGWNKLDMDWKADRFFPGVFDKNKGPGEHVSIRTRNVKEHIEANRWSKWRDKSKD